MLRPLLFVLLALAGCVRPDSSAYLSLPVTTLASFDRFYAPRADAVPTDSNVVVFPFHPDDTLAFVPRLVRPVGPATLSPAERWVTDSLVKVVERAQQLGAYHYRYQYLPVVDGRGAKHVWVQGMCLPSPLWATRTVAPKGGGACFYRVQLNLTAPHYMAFGTNAPK